MSRRYPDRPWVGIGVVLLHQDQVLLIRRGRPPGEGEWSLPGGAQHVGETAEAAARRELREECGLEAGPLALLGHVDGIHHDAQGTVEFHYTILDFGGWCAGGELRAGDDVAEARWVRFEDVAGFKVRLTVAEMIGRARNLARP
jgi:8-oxo-dGTP diphosphatase